MTQFMQIAPLAEETIATDNPQWNQTVPQLTYLADGRLLAVWMHRNGDGSDGSFPTLLVRGQVYAPDGSRIGGEILITDGTRSGFSHPTVTALSGGGFAVGWFAPGGGEVRVYDAALQPVGPSFSVNTQTFRSSDPSLIALEDGGFRATWSEAVSEGMASGPIYQDIFSRTFDAAGLPTGAAQRINTTTPGDQLNSAAAALASGGTAFIWTDNPEWAPASLRGRTLGADGTPLGLDFHIAGGLPTRLVQPAIAALADGSFVVAWRVEGAGVQARIYGADGVQKGGDVSVAAYATGAEPVDVAALPSGGFAVVWAGAQLKAQLFAADGSRVGAEVIVTQDGSARVAIAANQAGDFSIAWEHLPAGQSSASGQDVKLRSFASEMNLVAGDDQANNLVGTARPDLLRGHGGDDVIDGGLGYDTIEAGEGNDTVTVTAGSDIVHGGFGTDTLIIDYSGDAGGQFRTILNADPTHGGYQGSFYDSHNNSPRVDFRSIERFVITAGAGDDVITTGAGDDRLNGGAGADILTGGGGDDILDGGTGADRMTGGSGNDVYIVDNSGDVVVEGVNEGTDEVRTALPQFSLEGIGHVENLTGTSASGQSLRGNDLANIIILGNGNDRVYAGAGDDIVHGNGGNDAIEGGPGANTLYGGDGNDRLFAYDSGGSTLHGEAGSDLLVSGAGADLLIGGEGDDYYHNIGPGDMIEELPGGGRDSISTDDTVFSLEGYAGVEDLSVGIDPFNPVAHVLTGNDLGNRISGGDGDDHLTGLAGNDILLGGMGADRLTGGTGDDYYEDVGAGDIVEEAEGEGIDHVSTALGSRTDFSQLYGLPANVENLLGFAAVGQGISGNALDNRIRTGAGGDLVMLDAGGDDHVSGGGGNDYLYWGAAFNNADRADGGAGKDTLGLLGTYQIAFDADDLTNIEKLALYSSGNPAAPNGYNLTMHDASLAAGQTMTVIAQSLSAIEVLSFNGAAELDGKFNIRGGKGADTITGGAGNDVIWGNLGADMLRGGKGNDLFDYNAVAESKFDAADTILHFARGDRINLGRIDADGNAANGNSKFSWLSDGAFTGAAGELRVSQHPQHSRTWVVEADVDGDKVADLTIYLVGPAGFLPQAGDFIL